MATKHNPSGAFGILEWTAVTDTARVDLVHYLSNAISSNTTPENLKKNIIQIICRYAFQSLLNDGDHTTKLWFDDEGDVIWNKDIVGGETAEDKMIVLLEIAGKGDMADSHYYKLCVNKA